MAKQIALLKYVFLCQPKPDTYTNASDFDLDLLQALRTSSFFLSKGLQIETVETQPGASERVLFISPAEPRPVPTPPTLETRSRWGVTPPELHQRLFPPMQIV